MKKFVFRLVRLLIIVICIEAFSYGMMFLVDGKPASLATIREEKDKIIAFKADPFILAQRDLGVARHTFLSDLHTHPYFGFTLDSKTQFLNLERWIPITRDWETVLRKDKVELPYPLSQTGPENALFMIGITGGSVAGHFFEKGRKTLLDELGRCEALKGKRFEFVNMTVHGYKEPQQLMVLNYYLAMGGHLDMLINLDGFNEVTLPISENVVMNVNPFYPRSWFFLSQGLSDRRTLVAVAEMTRLLERTQALAAFTDVSPMKQSWTMALIWRLCVLNAGNRISRIHADLQSDNEADNPWDGRTYTDIYGIVGEECEQLWMNCSELMNALCRDKGICYYHFLQPNQYVPGSKPMSRQELQEAMNSDTFRELVEAGYPGLRTRGQELAAQGVRFHDLTMVFDDVTETLYYDGCCHFNQAGNEILGHEIGRIIVADLCD